MVKLPVYGERDLLLMSFAIRTGLSNLLKPLNDLMEFGEIRKEEEACTHTVFHTACERLFLRYLFLRQIIFALGVGGECPPSL
mmetsp:Transcript_57496/g.151329  ORF Transcript_57496/g.151329 Transcript_57496/m.151329 type:complete len:83 (-) Transcript_57496:40-288(-)